MERALVDLVGSLHSEVSLVILSGGKGEHISSSVATELLDAPSGWKGRLRAIRGLRRAILSRNSDRVVAVGIWAYIPCALALVGTRRRVVLWEHSILPWRLRNELRVLLAAFALRALAHRCEKVISVSRTSERATRMLVWPFARTVTIPNIVDPVQHDKLEIDLAASQTVNIVGIGSLCLRKNWALAIEAMPYLPEDFVLKIAGDGPERNSLETLIDGLGLGSRVELLGYVQDVTSLLKSASVIVHPSHAETFGFALVEAAEFQVPMVALNKPVMNEMIPEAVPGCCVNPGDPRVFAEGIEVMVARPPSFEQVSDARQYRASWFASASVTEMWSDAIDLEPSYGMSETQSGAN
ncbi:glycosyltransferase [Gordonia alkanivorans]|uniref:glycosyltransferase n=1 Tax=Gordonia alkanivorans TaxID=84096 RepID=UPI00244C1540|nr:glycosyltransferase [Gordonia alkanivorans]MDH3026959.1 glycosyltransferase [Gordonia alkanivorans]